MNKLKKILIYFFITFLIFPSEVQHLVTFIPDFINHYQHHIDEHHDLSFYEFIVEHPSDKHHDTEKHEQDSCPINHNHSQVSINLALIDPIIQPNFMFVDFSNERTKLILDKNKSISSAHLSSIWQPPKFC